MIESSIIDNKKQSGKILLIDDEETCVISMNILLQDTHYELMVAEDGRKALSILNNCSINCNINLILLDLMLPDIHGIEILKIIKSIDCIKSVPVIIHTGCSSWQDIKTTKLFGAEGLIRKPCKKDILIKTIEKFF